MIPIKLFANARLQECLFKSQSLSVHYYISAKSKCSKINLEELESKVELPPKPKKPQTPYIQFSKEFWKNNPEKYCTDVSVKISKEWKQTDHTKYEEEYKRLREQYFIEKENYEKSLSEEQRAFLKLKNQLIKEHKAFKELKKIHPLPLGIKNPSNMFIKEMLDSPKYKLLKTIKPMHIIFRDLNTRWLNATDEERELYRKKSEDDKKRFVREIQEWYQGVMSDVTLRKSVLEQATAYYQRYSYLLDDKEKKKLE